MTAAVHLGTIRTQIPARLDRLPWSRFHWRIVAGLGTVWILDGLEVTIVGSIGSRLTEKGSGVSLTAAGIGSAAAIYVAGACVGALVFGQLTDRFGRKRLMMLTLAVYIVATIATAFSVVPWYFFLCRFFTGAGIGGEYAAINSAIDELIPARNRGQVDITINGSYWVGSAVGGLAALLFLDTSIFPQDIGWRISFAVGAILGVGILLVRRSVPESPRWLFIHGRDEEAERLVDEIEAQIRAQTHQELSEPGDAITVRQRAAIPFREIAKVALRYYPKRATLGFALFIGQAFLYNAVTFNLGTLLSTFYGVSAGAVPGFMVIFAVGNFLGPFLLGRLFDTVGRKPMISGTYLGSSALTVVLGILLVTGGLNAWSFIALVGITFFFASAGASSAYLTVSEIFPMETRALAIAFFYAIGTGIGGISGPLLFGNLVNSHRASTVAIGFFIGVVVMALGGVAELAYGVRAEGVPLENIAKPLTVADAERAAPGPTAIAAGPTQEPAQLSPGHRAALRCRERAEEERVRAFEHRAAADELPEAAVGADGNRREIELLLAQIAELRAQGLSEEAGAFEARTAAEEGDGEAQRRAGLERAQAGLERARVAFERAEALQAEHRRDADVHTALSEAAIERARAHEQRALAEQARGDAVHADAGDAQVALARAKVHDAWAVTYLDRAYLDVARAEHAKQDIAEFKARAERDQAAALAAQDRLEAARHGAELQRLQGEEGTIARTEEAQRQAAERVRRAQQRDERIRARIAHRQAREHSGLNRLRPGPGDTLYSPGMVGTASRWAPTAEQDRDREIDTLTRALNDVGRTDRDHLAQRVGARYWGPGRFRDALAEAVAERRIQRLPGGLYALVGPPESAQPRQASR